MSVAFNIIDKTSWPSGPWQGEPDIILFHSPYGHPCAVLRHAKSGHLCGYICVPPDHPWTNEDKLRNVAVHGGVTWSTKMLPTTVECNTLSACGFDPPDDLGFWVGFHCAHYDDFAPGLCNFGFPDPIYRDLEYVLKEVKVLAEQAFAAECKDLT